MSKATPASFRTTDDSPLQRETMSVVIRKISPFVGLLFFVAFLDRVNVSFAAITMKTDLGLSDVAYGTGAGLFFIGYFLAEIPSNMMLERFGARRWLARIMISWGLISVAMAFVNSATSFYVLRFLLGLGEAGFYPGLMLYFTYWFPMRYRARVVGFLMFAIPVASFVGAPLSTGLMTLLDGAHGLPGWRWLFVLEGLPAVILGIATMRYLADNPLKARWLRNDQRAWLIEVLDGERALAKVHAKGGWLAAISNPKVLCVVLMLALNGLATNGVNFWLPQLVKSFGLSTFQTGLVASIPYGFAGIAVVFWGLHSDFKRERVWHYAIAGWVAAAGLFIAGYTLNQPVLNIAALTLAVIGVNATQPAFWTMTGLVLAGTNAVAVGFAFVNSLGNLTGYVGPVLVGWLKQSTGSFGTALFVLGCTTVLMGALPFTLRRYIVEQEHGSGTVAHAVSDKVRAGDPTGRA
ncbi:MULTISPECIES: MFS transporter [Burkholderiaceae]|uniref:MFS transporter n=1 Tax=Burkholderiaceae TaxID=119060 RepID=UPI0014232AFC|nr:MULTISPECIES: MFS transporter [Burkholderiaceae]MBN3846597.1 MFS transporter [Paraburkholderia sp. Ac-20342]NIF55682.1 MFS transporter [Burkholderia sp. Ax-1724]NIF78005.1 MFS transporter [Paraburkholderia sp. Cy-641]